MMKLHSYIKLMLQNRIFCRCNSGCRLGNDWAIPEEMPNSEVGNCSLTGDSLNWMSIRWGASFWSFYRRTRRKQVDGNRPSFNDKRPTFPQKNLSHFSSWSRSNIPRQAKVVIWFSWHFTKIHHANYSGTCGEIQHAEKGINNVQRNLGLKSLSPLRLL